MQRKTHPNLHHISGWIEKVVERFQDTSLKMWQDRCKKFFIFKDGCALFLGLLKTAHGEGELLNAKITAQMGRSADGFGRSGFV